MKRPLGLQSGSTLYQPHHLLALLGQIAETSPDTMAHSIMQLSADQARRRPACILELERVLHAPVSTAMLECSVKCAALAVLWASFHVQESGLTVASTIGEAAGLQGRRQWGLILPSSARVSLLTYQTVVAVRYPGLVHTDQGIVSYGRFFTTDVNQAGGFLPIVWEVPGTLFEFGPDAAESLTVLHNRTNMVRVFGNSVTVKNSEGETRTRCVTSCAGSTSYMSVVAQTRRGFLSGGSASQTKNMTDQEKEIQLEEAYARATVALTRARRLCVLLCPLDQKGPIGAATILGCVQYGLGHLHFSDLAMPLWSEAVRLTSPSDASFLRQLEVMSPHSLLPPVSLLVMRPSRDGSDYTFVRLHLIVVDLYRHWYSNRKGVGVVWRQMRNAAPYCTPMASHDSITGKPHANDRYAFGYARDNSTFPVFLIHPVRQRSSAFTLVTLYTGALLPLDSTPEISILSLEHFYDSFRVVPMACLRSEVLAKYNLTPDMLTGDLRVSQRTAAALSRPDVRDLVPEDNAEESENDPVSGWSERTPRDVRDPEGDVAMSQSSWTSSEDTSVVVSDADEVEQDHELFLEAYSSFKNQAGIFDSQKGLQEWFEGAERLPNSWPMARLSITLDGLVMQVEKVAMTAAMEIVASHIAPGECLPELTRLAKDLTVALALHLADLVASFLTGVLSGQTVLLFGTNTAALLQASYWVRPIFEELLYVSAHGFQGAVSAAKQPQRLIGLHKHPVRALAR